jgi:uncharacterized membrane protein required for colicin V production
MRVIKSAAPVAWKAIGSMHWLDSTIVALLAATAVLGAWSGLLMQAFRLAGFGASLYAATCLNAWGTNVLGSGVMRGVETRVASATAFAATFLVIYLTIFLLTLLLERGVRATQLQYLNRALGATLALAKMAAILGALAYGIQQLPFEPAKQVVDESVVAPLLARSIEQCVRLIPDDCKNEWLANWQQVQEVLPATNFRPKN